MKTFKEYVGFLTATTNGDPAKGKAKSHGIVVIDTQQHWLLANGRTHHQVSWITPKVDLFDKGKASFRVHNDGGRDTVFGTSTLPDSAFKQNINDTRWPKILKEQRIQLLIKIFEEGGEVVQIDIEIPEKELERLYKMAKWRKTAQRTKKSASKRKPKNGNGHAELAPSVVVVPGMTAAEYRHELVAVKKLQNDLRVRIMRLDGTVD